jgi:hypothetical protein
VLLAERAAAAAAEKVAAVRTHLADAWMYHVGRVTRSYDNQVVAQLFAAAFRVIADPVVQRAVRHFAESRSIARTLAVWRRQRAVLAAAVRCAVLWHRNVGWRMWGAFMRSVNAPRTEGLIEVVRRRMEVLVLFPYFRCVDVLPVRRPKPLSEVRAAFKGAPGFALRKKLARERGHHVLVRAMIHSRRIMREEGDLGTVDRKAEAEVPQGWIQYVQGSRKKGAVAEDTRRPRAKSAGRSGNVVPSFHYIRAKAKEGTRFHPSRVNVSSSWEGSRCHRSDLK